MAADSSTGRVIHTNICMNRINSKDGFAANNILKKKLSRIEASTFLNGYG
jgi:hypothetical protein